MKVVMSPKPNVIAVLKSSVSRTAKLPLAVIRGSEEYRYKKAKEFSDILLNKLEQVSDGKCCSVEDFNNIIKKILYPNKIKLSIKNKQRVHDLFSAVVVGTLSSIAIYDRHSTMIGQTRTDYYDSQISEYEMDLPLDRAEETILDKYVALHESRHLFDKICNPKTLVERDLGIDLVDSKRESFYSAYKCLVDTYRIPILEYFIKLKAQYHLSKLSDEEYINCLQCIKRSLKTEMNAYSDELAYLKKDYGKNFWSIIDTSGYRMHNYPKRLAMVNQMLGDKLAEVREKIHKNNSSKTKH